ncbi:MAG: LytR/AlgR family response regulator transcription factor [Candidatus Cyclobacteriaceae bacterium M3_2C_046]
MKINCLIVDDEQLARTLLKSYMEKVPELNLIADCKNPLEANQYLQSESVDLMFLDIQMPDLTGIEFLRTLTNSPVVIFTTAYPEYALESYKFQVIDYLLKPFSLERFLQAINKAINLIRLKKNNTSDPLSKEDKPKSFINIKADHKIIKLPLKNIQYIEGLKEYVSFYTTDQQRIISLLSLKNLEEQLPQETFMRIHKSYIINFEHISAVEGNQVIIGIKKIPIGKNYREAFMNRFMNG